MHKQSFLVHTPSPRSCLPLQAITLQLPPAPSAGSEFQARVQSFRHGSSVILVCNVLKMARNRPKSELDAHRNQPKVGFLQLGVSGAGWEVPLPENERIDKLPGLEEELKEKAVVVQDSDSKRWREEAGQE